MSSDSRAPIPLAPARRLMSAHRIRENMLPNSTTMRKPGTICDILDLQTDIARQMDGEFSKCGLDSFFKTYMPFNPNEEDVDEFVNTQLAQDIARDVITDVIKGDGLRQPKSIRRSKELNEMPLDQDDLFNKGASGHAVLRDFQPASTSQHATEISAYQRLQDIADLISTSAVTGRSRNDFFFSCSPGKRIAPGMHAFVNQVDACIASRRTLQNEATLEAHNIAVVFAFELDDDPIAVIRNNQQAVSANVQIMNDDFRRTSAFGVTIVRDQVRLIHHGRSGSVVSEAFSLVESPKLLVKVFMAFLFATTEELGYDSTVTRLEDGKYVFKMPRGPNDAPAGRRTEQGNNPTGVTTPNSGENDIDPLYRYYRISKPLAIYQSNSITGRTSRVWLVDILDTLTSTESKGQAVLKDLWLDEGANNGREIQERLFRDILDFWNHPQVEQTELYKALKFLGPELKEVVESGSFRNYFLNILTDWIGKTSPKLPEDAYRVKCFLLPSKEEEVMILRGESVNTSTDAGVRRPIRAEIVDKRSRRTPHRKRQYRVVFDEFCTSVDALGTLGEAMETIYGALTPLRLMFSAGWVHRDISAGNIMAHHSGGRLQAKLCDLEYARKFPPDDDYSLDGGKEIGSPYFMAYEIINGYPMFDWDIGPSVHKRPETREEMYAMFKENKEKKKAAASNAQSGEGSKQIKKQVPFTYNFQHDIESIYWVSLWNVTARIEHEPSRSFARRIFRNEVRMTKERHEALFLKIRWDLLGVLAPEVQPQTFALFLEEFRSTLIREYRGRQDKFDQPNVTAREEYANMHLAMESAFVILEVDENTEWRKVVLLKDEPVKLAVSFLEAQPDAV